MSNLQIWMCPNCKKVFRKQCKLSYHMNSHTGERPFACQEEGCFSKFSRPDHLKRHLSVHYRQKADVLRFECQRDGCSNSYTSAENLKKHTKNIHDDPALKYKCSHDVCGQAFRKKDQLRHHLREHDGSSAFQCSTSGCNKSFKTSSGLSWHRKKHAKGYRCRYKDCGEEFSMPADIAEHQKTHKTKGVLCPVCEKRLNARSLDLHMETHREMRTQLSCPREGCERKYFCKSSLRTHINVHHERKRYKCGWPGCTRQLSSLQKRKFHFERIHQSAKVKMERTKRKCVGRKKQKQHYYASLISGYTPSTCIVAAADSSNCTTITSDCMMVASACTTVTSDCTMITSDCTMIDSDPQMEERDLDNIRPFVTAVPDQPSFNGILAPVS